LRELGFDATSFSAPGMDLNQTGLSVDLEQMQAALGESEFASRLTHRLPSHGVKSTITSLFAASVSNTKG